MAQVNIDGINMETYSIDPDRLPHCPFDNTRTHMLSMVNQDETIEECPRCGKVFKFVVESDEDAGQEDDDQT